MHSQTSRQISLDWQLKIDNCWLELDVRRLGGCVWLALKQVNAIADDEDEDEAAAEAAPDANGNGNVWRPLPRHVRGVQCLTQCAPLRAKINGPAADRTTGTKPRTLSRWAAEHSCLGVALRCRRSCQWRLRKAFDVGRQSKLSALVAFSCSMLNFPSDCRVVNDTVFLEYVSLCLSSLPPTSLPSVYLPLYLPLSACVPLLVSVCSTLPYANVCVCVLLYS